MSRRPVGAQGHRCRRGQTGAQEDGEHPAPNATSRAANASPHVPKTSKVTFPTISPNPAIVVAVQDKMYST